MELRSVGQSAMRLLMNAMIAYIPTLTLFEGVLLRCDVEFLAQANQVRVFTRLSPAIFLRPSHGPLYQLHKSQVRLMDLRIRKNAIHPI